jgi:hypothetical protein
MFLLFSLRFENIVRQNVFGLSIKSLPILPILYFLRNGSLPTALKILVAPLVQTTKTPSLQLVVTSYWYLLESLIVTKDEATDKGARGKSFKEKN